MPMNNQNPLPWSDQGLILRLQHVIDTRDAILDCSSAMLQRGDNTKRCVYLWGEQFMKYLNEGRVERDLALLHVVNDILFCPSSGYRWVEDFGPVLCEVMPMAIHCANRKGEAEICRKIQRLPRIWLERQALTVDVAQELIKRCNRAAEPERDDTRQGTKPPHPVFANQENSQNVANAHQQPNALPPPVLNPKDIDESIMFAHHIKKCVLEKKLQIFEENNLEEQNRLRQWQETQLRIAKNQYEMLVMHEQHKKQMADLKTKHENRAAELRVAWVQELQQWRNTVETFGQILRSDPPSPEWLADLLQNCRIAQQCDKTAEDMERLISQIVEDKQHILEVKPCVENLTVRRADPEPSVMPLQIAPQTQHVMQQKNAPPPVQVATGPRQIPPEQISAPPVDQVNRSRTDNNDARAVENKQLTRTFEANRVHQCGLCPTVFFMKGAIKTFFPDRFYHHFESGQEAKLALEAHLKEVHSPERDREKQEDKGNASVGAARLPSDEVIVVKKEPEERTKASLPSDQQEFYPFNPNKRLDSDNYVLKNGPRGYGYYMIVENVQAPTRSDENTRMRGDESETASQSSSSKFSTNSNAGGTIAQIIQQRMKRKQEEERAKKEKDEAEQRLRMEREEEMRRRDMEEMKLRAELQRMKEQLIVERAKLKSERGKLSENSERESDKGDTPAQPTNFQSHRPTDSSWDAGGSRGRTTSDKHGAHAEVDSQPEEGDMFRRDAPGYDRRGYMKYDRDPRQVVRDPRQAAGDPRRDWKNRSPEVRDPRKETAQQRDDRASQRNSSHGLKDPKMLDGDRNQPKGDQRNDEDVPVIQTKSQTFSNVPESQRLVAEDQRKTEEGKNEAPNESAERARENGVIPDSNKSPVCDEEAGEKRGEVVVDDLMRRVGCDEETARAALCAAADDVAAAEELILESRKMEERILTNPHAGLRPKLRSSVQAKGFSSPRSTSSHKDSDDVSKEEATSCVSSEYSSESEREEVGDGEESKEETKESLEGDLQLPLSFSKVKVITLGYLPSNPTGYYQGNIVMPVGYEAHRVYYDLADSKLQTEYCCVIREGPRFHLYNMKDKMISFFGSSPDDPWRQLVTELNRKFDLGLNERLCGFTMFGLKHYKVAKMIQTLEGYDKYVKYLLKGCDKPSRGEGLKAKRTGKRESGRETKVSVEDFSRQEVRAGQALLELFDYYSMAQEQLNSVDSSTEVARKLIEQEIRTSNAPRLEVGMRVRAKWKARYGLQGWYYGTIVKIGNDGRVDVDYDDGDFEQGVLPINVKIVNNGKKRKGAQAENENLQLKSNSKAESSCLEGSKIVKKAKTKEQEKSSKDISDQDKEISQQERLHCIRTCQLILKDLMQKEIASPFIQPDPRLLRSLIGSFGMSVELARSKNPTDLLTISKKIDQTLNSTRRSYKNPSQIREDVVRVLRYFCLFYGEESAVFKQATEQTARKTHISYDFTLNFSLRSFAVTSEILQMLGAFHRCYYSQIDVLDHLGLKVFEHGDHWLGQRLRRFCEEEKAWRECIIDDYDGSTNYHVLFSKQETEDWIVLPSFDVQLISPRFQTPAELQPIRAGNHILCEDRVGGHDGIFFHAEVRTSSMTAMVCSAADQVEEYRAEDGRAFVHFSRWPRRCDQWVEMETSRVFLVDSQSHAHYANGRVMCTDEDTPRSIARSFGVDIDKLLLMDYPGIQKSSRFKRGAMLLLPMQPFVFERMQEARSEAGEEESRSNVLLRRII
eukprot:750350-Hanusia_phi.AAC.2